MNDQFIKELIKIKIRSSKWYDEILEVILRTVILLHLAIFPCFWYSKPILSKDTIRSEGNVDATTLR